MENDILVHSCHRYDGTIFRWEATFILKQIFYANALLSRRQRGWTDNDCNFAGIDYISLSDYSKREYDPHNYSAYELFSKKGLSLLFDKSKVNYIVPKYVEIRVPAHKIANETRKYGLSEDRYSDLVDEVQVKDTLSLDSLVGISYPLRYMKSKTFVSNKSILNEIVKINQLIDFYHYDVSVYDIETLEPIFDEMVMKL